MFGLCFARALWRRSGAAYWLMATDFGSLDGSSTVSTLVILPPSIVTLSSTGPYWVETASPVTVFVAAVEVELEDFEDFDDFDDFDGDARVVVDATVAFVVGVFAWALKPSVKASPAAVAARTMG